jgi:hypothetical protein
MPLQDLHLIGQTDFPNQLPDPNSNFFRQNLPSVFRDPNEMQLDIISGMRRRSIKLHAANYTKVIA